jgi:cell division protein ZapA (FtsZ GTPase activity inhibitor)
MTTATELTVTVISIMIYSQVTTIAMTDRCLELARVAQYHDEYVSDIQSRQILIDLLFLAALAASLFYKLVK